MRCTDVAKFAPKKLRFYNFEVGKICLPKFKNPNKETMNNATQATATETAKKATVKSLTVADLDSAINAGNLANVSKVDLQKVCQTELLPIATKSVEDRDLESDFADVRIKRLVQQLNKATRIMPEKRTDYQSHVAGLADHLASSLKKEHAKYMRIVSTIQYRRNG